ncbi:MAG: hypothetical protein MJK14_08575 [Rivularia sp. ALOHA_DT_140]|nr:hypothetical protein [Rivularia sp. ALOHA_DT_140]
MSNTLTYQTDSWNGLNDFIIHSSRIINQTAKPVVISDNGIVYGVMPLNLRLAPHVKLILLSETSESTKIEIPDKFSDVFLWKTSDKLRSQIERKQNLNFKPIFQDYKREVTIWESSSPATLWKSE